jgi:hypothetical protein
MHTRPTSQQRYRSAEEWAEFERTELDIPDRPAFVDQRQAFPMLLKSAGWRDVWIDPRDGYVSWRCVDQESGEVLHCAALKELMRWIARQLPRMFAARNYQ